MCAYSRLCGYLVLHNVDAKGIPRERDESHEVHEAYTTQLIKNYLPGSKSF
jgi:hypothetical protein